MKQANVYYIITDIGHISWGRGVGWGCACRLRTCYVSANIYNITEGGRGPGVVYNGGVVFDYWPRVEKRGVSLA